MKLDIEPTIVIVSTRADRDTQSPDKNDGGGSSSSYGRILSDLRLFMFNSHIPLLLDAQFQLPYQIDIRPSQEFSYETAKTKLTNLKLSKEIENVPKFLVPGNAFSHEYAVDGEDLGFTDQQGKFLHLASTIDMENQVSIGCAGALITYLQRKRSTQYLQGDSAGDQQFSINAIKMLSLEGSM